MPFLLLMPSYNQARYIDEAVRSILAQDDPDWELWILDNSTDETPRVMQAFDDRRIHFHHVPARMDPGSCLNWMLERARGDAFSYVHTDNRLQANYVSTLRAALAGKPMGLAYCDMREIDRHGTVLRPYARGRFDLARLFSLSPLGVPFAATRELAKAVGGFRANDLADDVRFCTAAHGLADYVYVDQPLLEYRSHDDSRWSQSGWSKIQQAFLDLFLELRPQCIARGAPDPLHALTREVAARFDAVERAIEEVWQHTMSRALPAWWDTGRTADHLFHAGLVRVKGFSGDTPRPPLKLLIRRRDGHIAAWPWSIVAAARLRSQNRHEIWRLAERIPEVLLPWAYLTLGGHVERFGVGDTGFATLYAARLLEVGLGWKPCAARGVDLPRWLRWPRASDADPVLSMEDTPHWVRR